MNTRPENRTRIYWRWNNQGFRTWMTGFAVDCGNDLLIEIRISEYTNPGSYDCQIVSINDIEWKPMS